MPVLIAVAHDILITAGVYSLADREVSSATVAAFLTILGYSLYDTVIVFDRIRENVPRMPRAAFSQIVNRSMSEVLTRSLITGLSSVFLVGMLLVFGGETLKDFAFAMMVGIASGTYSSIFIASPVLTAWKEREPAFARRRERIEQALGYVPAFAEEIEIARLARGRARRRGGRRSAEPRAGAGAEPPAGRRPSRMRSRDGELPARSRRAEPETAPRRRRAVAASAAASASARAPSASPATPQAREAPLMALIVWFTMGIALWHFTVFVPDRFWQGIVGASRSARCIGAMITGAIVQIATGRTIGDTDVGTALMAVPGALIGIAVVYAIGAPPGARRPGSPSADFTAANCGRAGAESVRARS